MQHLLAQCTTARLTIDLSMLLVVLVLVGGWAAAALLLLVHFVYRCHLYCLCVVLGLYAACVLAVVAAGLRLVMVRFLQRLYLLYQLLLVPFTCDNLLIQPLPLAPAIVHLILHFVDFLVESTHLLALLFVLLLQLVQLLKQVALLV